jgi:hypothetical protein
MVERDVMKTGYKSKDTLEKYEAGKKIFLFNYFVQSTVHMENNDFKPFFDAINAGIDGVDNSTLIQAFRSIANVKKGQLNLDSSFLLLILDNLFKVLDSNRDSKLKRQAFLPMMHLFDLFYINDKEHAHLFAYYVKYVMNFPNVHEEILINIINFIENNKVESTLESLPFFNSILLKSMVLKTKEDPTYEFTTTFKKTLQSYVVSIAALIMEIYALNSSDGAAPAKVKAVLIGANGEIASLLRHFLSFSDRTFIVSIILAYSSRLMYLQTKKNQVINLTLQVLFYQEIFKYPNYMILFLPKEEGKDYFLFNGFIEIFKQCMKCEERDVRLSAIITLRELVYKTTTDPRYEKFQQRISKMYLHLIEEFLLIFPDWKKCSEKKLEEKALRIRSSEQKIQETEPLLANLSTGDPKEKSLITLVTATKKIIEVQERDLKLENLISNNEKKHLFTSIIQILESLDKESIEEWFKSTVFSSQFVAGYFLNLLHLIVESFSYLGSKNLLEIFEGILTINRQKLKEQNNQVNKDDDESGYLVFNIQPGTRLSTRKSISSVSLMTDEKSQVQVTLINPADQVRIRSPFLKQLCHRSSLFVFDILSTFIEVNKGTVFKNNGVDNVISNNVEDIILKIFISYMSTNQSENILIMVLSYLKYFMSEQIRGILKIGEDFSKHLMNLCQSQLESVRSHSSAAYYLFVRYAFEATKGIARPKLIATRTLSKILGDEESNKIQLVRTFKEIQNYPSLDENLPNGKRTRLTKPDEPFSPREKKSSYKKLPHESEQTNLEIEENEVVPFKEEIENLGLRLKSLLNDTVAEVKNKNSDNTYGYEELLIRISNGYSHVPQLRNDWLLKLADHHTSEKVRILFFNKSSKFIKIL